MSAVAESRPRVLYEGQYDFILGRCIGDRDGGHKAFVPIVPSTDGRSGYHHLGDTNSFPFAAGDAPDIVVADLGVVRVRQAAHSHDDLGDVFAEVRAGHALVPILGRPRSSGEL